MKTPLCKLLEEEVRRQVQCANKGFFFVSLLINDTCFVHRTSPNGNGDYAKIIRISAVQAFSFE